MNIETLRNIKIIENDHTLEILIMNETLNISMNALLAVRDLGNITIVVSNPMAASSLIGKVCGMKNYKVVLTHQIPIKKYDILLANTTSELSKLVIKKLGIKYLCFFTYVEKGFPGNNYLEFDHLCFKMKGLPAAKKPVPVQKPVEKNPEPIKKVVIKEEAPIVSQPEPENNVANYEMVIKDVAALDMVYEDHKIKYLHDMIPGMTSIIMIVSEKNNKFAETIKALKAQNVAAVEYIVVDNNAAYRNNIAPNIRYGEKMPEDFCIEHAKELCSGEYMIVLNQDSDEFDILATIESGKYEKR